MLLDRLQMLQNRAARVLTFSRYDADMPTAYLDDLIGKTWALSLKYSMSYINITVKSHATLYKLIRAWCDMEKIK